MGWRDFNILLGGLNPWGAVATHYKEVQKRINERENRADGKPTADTRNFWAALDSLKR